MLRRIYLTGMACSGKTTVGKDLARKLDWRFFDTDAYIKEKYNVDFRDLIKKDPERFHSLELEALKNAGKINGPCVVATGGRTYLNLSNKKYMNANGDVLFINTSIKELLKRFNKAEQSKRALPLMRLPIWIALPIVYLMRKRHYEDGTIIIDGDGSPNVVMNNIFAAGEYIKAPKRRTIKQESVIVMESDDIAFLRDFDTGRFVS